MLFCTVADAFFTRVRDSELLDNYNEKRPHILAVTLSYKGEEHLFAIPFRSNISPNAPKWQYYGLPPNRTTKSKHRHGLQFLKMYPVPLEDVTDFDMKSDSYFQMLEMYIEGHEEDIIREAQAYLDGHTNPKHPMAPDIDKILGYAATSASAS